ncbi:MAG: hypothetical protein AAF938_15045 [Myxococcota bacterium]
MASLCTRTLILSVVASLLAGCSLLKNRDEFTLRDAGVDSSDVGMDGDTSIDSDSSLSEVGPEAGPACESAAVEAGGSVNCPPGIVPSPEGTCAGDTYRDFSMGPAHGCAIRRSDDVLVCWGINEFGEAFSAAEIAVERPQVAMWAGPENPDDIPEVRAHDVVAGERVTCFLWNNDDRDPTNEQGAGPAYCIGSNQSRRTGRPTTGGLLNRPRAVCVPNDSGDCDELRPVPEFIQLATRGGRVCGLTSLGEVWCWGNGNNSVLGVSGTEAAAVSPRRIADIEMSATEDSVTPVIVMTDLVTCGLGTAGRVRCFGNGELGELGNGTDADAFGQSDVRLDDRNILENVRGLTANGQTICAAASTDIYCWGANSGNNRVFPADTRLLYATDVTEAFSVANARVAFLEGAFCYWADRDAWCRGNQSQNELGLGASAAPFSDSESFTRLPELDGFREVDGLGVHCGFRSEGGSDGTLRCWGYSAFGEFPRANLVLETPEAIAAPESIQTVAVEATGACLIGGADSAAYCSGRVLLDERGVEEDGRPFDGFEVIDGTEDSLDVVRASRGGCAQRDGLHTCWGVNANGTLGGSVDGAQSAQSTLSGVEFISMGATHACGLRDGNVVCWGDNATGQALVISSDEPVLPTEAEFEGQAITASQVAAGQRFTCAILAEGSVHGDAGDVMCWGENRFEQLGSAGNEPRARVIPGVANATVVAAGLQHACAATATGVYCWGNNGRMQRGSIQTRTFPPNRVTGLPGDIVALAASEVSTCAGTDAGEVFCWGGNDAYALGADQPPLSATSNPERVSLPCLRPQFRLVSHPGAGAYCVGPAVDDSHYCWGRNDYGKLGAAGSVYVLLPAE